MSLGQRRRRQAERFELVDQPLNGLPVGPLVNPVQRRHATLVQHPRHLFVGGDHQMLDQAV